MESPRKSGFALPVVTTAAAAGIHKPPGSRTYGMVWVGRDIKAHLVPAPCPGQGHLPQVQAAPSNLSSKLAQSRDSLRNEPGVKPLPVLWWLQDPDPPRAPHKPLHPPAQGSEVLLCARALSAQSHEPHLAPKSLTLPPKTSPGPHKPLPWAGSSI